MDYEPAPDHFPETLQGKYNYGVYSARSCNIYTVRQLVQLFQRAYGLSRPVEPFRRSAAAGAPDAFRPLVEPAPFASVEDLEQSQKTHFAAVRRVFEDSDLFIFTLGPTEAWEDVRDGSIYPLCPGTAAGEFNAETYRFRNFTCAETLEL